MAIINWESIGGAAHKGDMDRAQMDLAMRKQVRDEEYQDMALKQKRESDIRSDATARAKLARDSFNKDRDFAYTAHKDAADNKIKADKNRLDFASSMAETQRKSARDEARGQYEQRKNAIADQNNRRLSANDSWKRMLDADKNRRENAQFAREEADWMRMNAEREEKKAAQRTSLGALVSAAAKLGFNKDGQAFTPLWMVDEFNKRNGTDVGMIGIVPSQEAGGKLTIALWDKLKDQNGNPVINPATGRPELAKTGTALNDTQLRLFASMSPELAAILGDDAMKANDAAYSALSGRGVAPGSLTDIEKARISQAGFAVNRADKARASAEIAAMKEDVEVPEHFESDSNAAKANLDRLLQGGGGITNVGNGSQSMTIQRPDSIPYGNPPASAGYSSAPAPRQMSAWEQADQMLANAEYYDPMEHSSTSPTTPAERERFFETDPNKFAGLNNLTPPTGNLRQDKPKKKTTPEPKKEAKPSVTKNESAFNGTNLGAYVNGYAGPRMAPKTEHDNGGKGKPVNLSTIQQDEIPPFDEWYKKHFERK